MFEMMVLLYGFGRFGMTLCFATTVLGHYVQWDSLNIVVKRGAASVSLDAQGGQLQVS